MMAHKIFWQLPLAILSLQGAIAAADPAAPIYAPAPPAVGPAPSIPPPPTNTPPPPPDAPAPPSAQNVPARPAATPALPPPAPTLPPPAPTAPPPGAITYPSTPATPPSSAGVIPPPPPGVVPPGAPPAAQVPPPPPDVPPPGYGPPPSSNDVYSPPPRRHRWSDGGGSGTYSLGIFRVAEMGVIQGNVHQYVPYLSWNPELLFTPETYAGISLGGTVLTDALNNNFFSLDFHLVLGTRIANSPLGVEGGVGFQDWGDSGGTNPMLVGSIYVGFDHGPIERLFVQYGALFLSDFYTSEIKAGIAFSF